MRLLNWLNRHLGKPEPSHNLQFDSHREDGNAKLELIRLEDRIVLSVSAGVTGDVLELNLDALNDEATVSVIGGGATIQVEELGLPGSILQFDATQVSSILVTGTDPSQVINFLGQENLVLPGSIDLAPFSGNVNIGIQIQVGLDETLQFNPASTVSYRGQFQLTGDQLDVVLPNELNASDAFIIQINGTKLEILDPLLPNPLLFSTTAASLNSINVIGADGETDFLTLNYSIPGLNDIAIFFDGGSGGNDVLEFTGGSFDTVTHDLTGPGTGMIDLGDNGITEISYIGLEPVFGGGSTANNIVINLPAMTMDAVLESSGVLGEMQISSLSAAFEVTTFASPETSLTINTAGGNSVVALNSFDTTFTEAELILSGNPGDSYQLTGNDLLADTVSLTLSGGAILDLGTFNETVNGFILEEGTVIATSGILTAQSDLELRSGSVKAQLNGTDLVKNGMETVILDAANIYTGQTIINDGVLQLAQFFAIPNTSNVDLTSATSVLDLNGFEVSLTSLTGTGSVQLGGPSGTLDVNQATATSSTFAGSITGDGSLTKSGAGEFILSGTNSFTGSTSIQNGVVNVEGSLTTSQVIVSAGALPGGSGSINAPVIVNSGGRLAPGSSPGITSTGNLTLAAGSTLEIEIEGTTVGTEYDQIQVTGTVDVTGATLNLISTFTASAADEFLLIDNDGVDAVMGTFAGLTEGTLISFNDNDVYISYTGGDGNDVVLTVNSPPASMNQIRSIDENATNGTNVGDLLVATDADLPGDTLIFSEEGGSGADAFNITAGGQIVVADKSLLNFETNPTYTLLVSIKDSAGETANVIITINLNDLTETLFVNPGDWAADDITLVRVGSQLRILETGTANEIVPSHNFANISNVIITGNGSNNTTRIDLNSADITLAGGINFNGGTGSNTIVAPKQTNDWSITGVNSGSLLSGTVIFSNVENLTGNDGADTFVMQDAGKIEGTIDGDLGFNILDFSADSDVVTFDISTQSSASVDLGLGISKIIGDNTQDRIIGGSAAATYVINGVNQGVIDSVLEFEGFNNLIGAAGIDIFEFTGTGQITGAIDGLAGADVLDYSASTAMLDLVLASTGSTDGFAGAEVSTVTSFDNINTIIGSGNTDSLTGINAVANWAIDGSNQYSSTNTLDFSEFENLAGGTNADTFTITGNQTHNIAGDSGNDIFSFQNGASLTGSIDGQSGADTLDYNLFTNSIDATLTNSSLNGFQGTESSISNGFDNINRIEAGTGVADQLTGRDAVATWTLQPSSIYESVTLLGFQNFETLQGGNNIDTFNINGAHSLDLLGGLGNDIFQFDNDVSTLSGIIDGQGDNDHLNLTNYTTDLITTLTGIGSTDGFDGNESAKSITFQNIDQLTGGSGTNSLTGINSAANWSLNGTNSYQSTNSLDFSNFVNLTGGTGSDIFNITPNAEAFNIFGSDPTSNPLGDQLNIDTSAVVGTALVSNNGDGSGSVTGTFLTVITYSEIENFDITGVVDVQVDGTTSNDNIIIRVEGSKIEYRIGGTLIGTSSLTETNHITVNGGDGDDSLTVDSALAAEGITIEYDGEGPVSPNPGDVLNLLGITTSVEYFFTNSSSGSVRIDGSMTDFIVYTGLEPITSTITTADVTLNYSGVSETIIISDAGGGQTTVTSTAGELLTFANPTNSLTINTGAGEDLVIINSLAAGFTASLTINGEAGNDTINANASISFDTGKLVEFNVETINVTTGITLTAAGIAFNATEVNLDGDLVSTNVSGDATTVNVPGSVGGADLQDAVDVAGNGGIINVDQGIYLTTGTLRVDESVSILGAGKDDVEIRKAGAPTSSFDIAVSISANNVTLSGAQIGWETHTSATDYRGYVVYTSADFTLLNNLLFSDNYRSAVVFEGANDLEVSDSIFEGKLGRAAIRDGDAGSGERFLITRNEFREDHFRWGPIAIGPQGTFGTPNNFAFSGEISFNYFGNGLEAGAFQEAGDQNYTVTITNGGMTSDGIDIIHNSFDWQDSATTNGNGIFAQPGGIFFDPSLAVPVGTVNITDNIFNGFTYDGPQPTTEPLWNPGGGVFGGALEFDGVDDFGLFQDASFDVGEAGTLSFWFKMDDQGRRNQFFEGPDNGGMEFQYRTNGGGQFFGSPNRNNGNGNTYVIQDGGAGGTEGVWQNIQYTWDFTGSGGPEMHIFIDGTEVGYLNSTYDSDLTQWSSTVSTINGLMNVARDPGSGRFFDGLMDDVGWFDQALNQADLDTIRNTGVAALAGNPSIVAHWDFDQSAGNVAVDNINNIEMFIATNGIVPFGPEFQPGAGQFGGALQFDGIDDFATFQDASFDVGKEGTLNFWVKMDDAGRRNQFFEGPDNGGFEFQYRTNGGGQFFGRTQDGADYTIQQGPHAGVEGVWTNIQYTWDADSSQMRIYLDGVEQSYLASFDENLAGFDSTHFTDTINGLMNVGRDPGDASRYFEGLVDDIGWFNKVLNQIDRDAIRASGVAALNGDSRLVAHWNLDDIPGTTVVPGDSGTNIDLYIQALPPLPPIQGFGVLAPLNANVTFNAFNNNDLDSNVTLDATNQTGDPLYAYASDPLFVNPPTPSLEEQFTIGFGSSAAYFSSEFAGDTNTMTPHIGAYQNPPTLYPGLFGEGDIEIFGTGEDDLLVVDLNVTMSGEYTATFVLTRDVGGAGETVLGTVLLTKITSITFNGLGGDDVLILNQSETHFFNPAGGITFNGGTQNNDGNYLNPMSTDGDTLVINHKTPINNPLEADSVAYVFTPDSVLGEGEDGVITINDVSMSDGSTTITFTGLKSVLDNLLVADRIFDFTDTTETISLSDDAVLGDMYSFIDSTLSAPVLFLDPTNLITIRTDGVGALGGDDSIEISTLDSTFDANLTILADNDDSVSFLTPTNLVTGDLFVTASTVDILAEINANSVNISSSGVSSTTFSDDGTVTTIGTQLYNNAVNFETNAMLTISAGANIEFASTVDGTSDLIIDTTANIIFDGAIGNTTPLSSLTTNAIGMTNINGGTVDTTGSQTYHDAIVLGVSTTFTSNTTGDITFNSSLTGGAGITIDISSTGNIILNGSVTTDANVKATADSTAKGAGGGGITMADGTIFNAGTGIVDLQAGDNISVSQVFTTTLSRLTSTAGGVVDAGDTGGADITANELVIRTATGAGSANPLETAVSLLAASNSDSGSIQIHNDLGGALLTITTVDGLAGITNSAGTPGDIIISNASPLTVNAPVTNGSGGNIDLESTGPGNLILNATVRAFGGNGNINVEAGDGILDFNDTGNASDHSVAGTGIFSGHGTSGVTFDPNMTLNSETGAIADIPPNLQNILTPQILATGDATVTGDFGRFTEQNFFITIDWGDGTVETTNFSNPGSFVFTHNYVSNPNVGNPAAPIPIFVTMQGDLQFTFSDGSGNLDFTTETGFLETPGDGLATVAIDTTPQVPLLLFPPTQEILDSTSNQQSVFTSKDTVSIESSINEANKNAERLVFLRILAPNGNVIEDVAIQESDLDNLPKLFKSLPDGRYQLYLKEAGEERIRLLMDVDIRGGKATDVTENQSSPAGNQIPANDNSTTQRQTEEPSALMAASNDFQEERKILTTVFSTDADHSSAPNDVLFSDRFTIDDSANALLMNQNISDANTKQSTTDSKGMQANTSEKVWSSAALLSGYFHGKSLLNKPAKQDEFEDAMGKYGRRLLNRHYDIFKRNH